MWFKNIIAYRLANAASMSAESLAETLASRPLKPCGNQDRVSRGFVNCDDHGLVHAAEGHLLFTMGVEQKLLPGAIVTRYAKKRIAEIEKRQGYKVGRKEAKSIKEAVFEELLPKALVASNSLNAWIDTQLGLLLIDTSSAAKAEELVELLIKTNDELQITPLTTQSSPVTAMTDWLSSGNGPLHFTIDRDLELRASGDSNAAIRYANHALEGNDVQEHISAGKRATRLGMTWNDRISFVLDEQMHLKKLQFLDIIKDEAAITADTADEMFELDFMLMSGEASQMMSGLIAALGGLGK